MAVLESPPIFTAISLYSLSGVLGILITAYLASSALLPKNSGWRDRSTFVWLAFDALIHFIFEGSFLYVSSFGRTAATGTDVFSKLWQEYARADVRWGHADPTVVSLELLTVFGAGPMCVYILYLLIRNDQSRHYWIVILSVAELYGGWMTFCPEWLTGNKFLHTENWLYLWVYLVFMNMIWVVIPFWLLADSYGFIARALRAQDRVAKKE